MRFLKKVHTHKSYLLHTIDEIINQIHKLILKLITMFTPRTYSFLIQENKTYKTSIDNLIKELEHYIQEHISTSIMAKET